MNQRLDETFFKMTDRYGHKDMKHAEYYQRCQCSNVNDTVIVFMFVL